MEPWTGRAEERAQYLLSLLSKVGCVLGEKAELGSLYFLYKAVFAEARTFPPKVLEKKTGAYPDYLSFLKWQLDDARERLTKEQPAWKEKDE